MFILVFLLIFGTTLHSQQSIWIQTSSQLRDKNNAKREIGKVLHKYISTPFTLQIEEPHLYPRALIDLIFQDIDGFTIKPQDTQKIIRAGSNPTYGEITSRGIDKLIDIIQPAHGDIFYDLGCGTGRCNVEMFVRSPVAKSIGIELSEDRYKSARRAQQNLSQVMKSEKNRIDPHVCAHCLDKSRSLEFRNQDILHNNWREALPPLHKGKKIIFYIASTCMSDNFLVKLIQSFGKLAAEAKAGQHGKTSGNIMVFTLKAFPAHDYFNQHFKKINQHAIDMTWSDSVPVYEYHLT